MSTLAKAFTPHEGILWFCAKDFGLGTDIHASAHALDSESHAESIYQSIDGDSLEFFVRPAVMFKDENGLVIVNMRVGKFLVITSFIVWPEYETINSFLTHVADSLVTFEEIVANEVAMVRRRQKSSRNNKSR